MRRQESYFFFSARDTFFLFRPLPSDRSLTKHHELAALVRQSRERYNIGRTIIASEIVATESSETVLNVSFSAADFCGHTHLVFFFFFEAISGSFSQRSVCEEECVSRRKREN